ncbi:putative transcription factor interactor and regulator CCHC(Zn) family [Helianthus annuus]|nr:putative transcription factor interactor and regulator CCHC(Zn) family [Helianthus annuus]
MKVENVIGDEQASESDSSENLINEPNPDSILACSIFNSVFRSVYNFRPNGLGENVDACVTATESADETNEPAEPSDSKCDSSEAADSEKLESVDSSGFSPKVSCAEPSCAKNSSNVSAEVSAKVSGVSSDKPELSDSVKADDMKDDEKTDVNKAPSKGCEKKKPKHQRRSGSPQSSTGSNRPQKAQNEKSAFVKPVCNGKCEKYAFDCANKAFEKTGEISEQDLQSNQNKKNQMKSPPQKAPANNKYRHPNSSSSAGNVQQNQAQKEPVRPSGPARANPADQNAFYLKRQTCFNYGIAGHIARNCTHRPYIPYHVQNQRVTPKDKYHSKPIKVSSPKSMKNVNPKVKPSNRDWNAAKNKRKASQEQKTFF